MSEAKELPEDSLSSISTYLWKEFELDPEDVSEMLDEYLKNLSEILCESRIHLKANDFQSLRKNGHSIKGIAGNIGAACVSALGKSLEEKSLAGDSKGCEELISLISAKHEALKASRDEKS